MTIYIKRSIQISSQHNVENYFDGRISPYDDDDLWSILNDISVVVTGSVTGFELNKVLQVKDLKTGVWELEVYDELLHLEAFENLSELEELL